MSVRADLGRAGVVILVAIPLIIAAAMWAWLQLEMPLLPRIGPGDSRAAGYEPGCLGDVLSIPPPPP